MSNFIIGNTHCRSLWTEKEAAARLQSLREKQHAAKKQRFQYRQEAIQTSTCSFLYLGVGDLRNPLKTLWVLANAADASQDDEDECSRDTNGKSSTKNDSVSNSGNDINARFVLNDAATMTLARDAALLVAAVQSGKPQATTALWCDALVEESERKILNTALESLLGLYQEKEDANNQALKIAASGLAWLHFDKETFLALAPHWRAWRASAINFDKNQELRKAAMKRFGDGAGHGRAKTSHSWVKLGVSTRVNAENEFATMVPNPLLYDFTDNATTPEDQNGQPRFVDSQGPSGAFTEVAGEEAGTATFAEVLNRCWNPLWKTLCEYVKAGKLLIDLVAGDCIELLTKNRFGEKREYAAIDTSNVSDYVGIWNMLLLLEPLLENQDKAFVQTESILCAAETWDELMTSYVPQSPSAARELARLMGLNPCKPPQSLCPDKEENFLRTRWMFHEPTQADIARMTDTEVVQSLVQELKRVAPVGTTLDEAKMETNLFPPEIKMFLELAKLNPEPRELEHAIKKILQQAEERLENTKDRTKAAFEANFSFFLQGTFVPQSVSSDMIRDPRETIDNSYPFPTHTVMTTALMLRSIARRSSQGQELASWFMENYFKNKTLNTQAHVRLRNMSFLMMCARVQNLPGAHLQTKLKAPPSHVQELTFETVDDVWKPKGGLMEPSLALLLLSKKTNLGKLLSRDSNRFIIDDDDDQEHNKNFDHLADATPKHAQIVDNIKLISNYKEEPARLIIQVDLPSKLPYTVAYLLDMQTYAILTQPVSL